MTKEPADWAKIKAYRAINNCREINIDERQILHIWSCLQSCHELARMYDKYEKPPADPDLLAARGWYVKMFKGHLVDRVLRGSYDTDNAVRAFLAGVEHGRANP